MLINKYRIGFSYFFISILWFLGVLDTLNIIHFPQNSILIILIISNVFLILKKNDHIMYLLPYAIVLSPIFGGIDIYGSFFLVSDFLIIFSFFSILLRERQKSSISIPSNTILLILVILLHTFLQFFIGNIVSIKSIFSIGELIIVYYITKSVVTKINISLFFNTTITAVCIGVLLMITSFYLGIDLNAFSGDSSLLLSNAKGYNIYGFYMNYFYTSFAFLISSSIFILIYKLSAPQTYVSKMFIIIIMVFLIFGLIGSGKKTEMYTTVIVLFFSIFLLYVKFGTVKNILKYGIAIFLLVYFVIINIFLDQNNSDNFSLRMTSDASLVDRFGVYINVLYFYFEKPFQIFLGFGSGFLTCCGNATASLLKVNYYTKGLQGTVDSGIISYIIEYGIILSGFLARLIYLTIKNAYYNLTKINIVFIQIISVLLIGSTTQAMGISKVLWFFIIIIVFARNRIFDGIEKKRMSV